MKLLEFTYTSIIFLKNKNKIDFMYIEIQIS